MIKPTRIRIRGYRSIKDEMEYTYGEGCTLIHGENGGGKTTVVADALFWCLFGTSLRGREVDRIINKDSKEASVSVDMEVPGLGPATFERARPTKGKSSFSVKLANGTDLLAGIGTSVSAKKAKVEDLLGMDQGTVQQVSFYCPELAFMNQRNSSRVKILEDMLGLKWVKEAQDASKSRRDAAAKEQGRAQTASDRRAAAAEELERTAKALEEKKEALTAQFVRDSKALHGAKTQELSVLLAEMQVGRNTIQLLTEKGKALEGPLRPVQEAKTELEARILDKELELSNAKQNEARGVERLRVFEERIQDLSSAGDVCPCCQREMDASAQSSANLILTQKHGKARTELRSLRDTVEGIKKGIRELEAKVGPTSKLSKAEYALNEAIAGISSEIASIEGILTTQETRKNSLETELGALQDRIATPVSSGATAI